MILAGIDIGTNTIRLLVADISDQGHRELYSGRQITRLGQDLDRTGVLSSEAQERSLAALREYTTVINRFPGCRTMVIGTSALRNARNAAEFIDTVRDTTSLGISVISGEQEARLTVLGVRRALTQGRETERDPLRSALVIDIGGGSTELIIVRNGVPDAVASLPLGAVYLTERFVRHDPPLPEELEELSREIMLLLDAWEIDILRTHALRPSSLAVLAGTAGTITTLASMEQRLAVYDPARINGFILTKEALDGWSDLLARTSVKDRRNITGLEQGREDIVLAGALIARDIMDRYGRQEMIVSDWGLREGIVFHLAEQERL
ncbi:MAG: Ppx/GppA family phosphatase [Nitrospirota bacterium]|nr:Ppx/GppA family phosphatase [Nitrospirota bacterium]